MAGIDLWLTTQSCACPEDGLPVLGEVESADAVYEGEEERADEW